MNRKIYILAALLVVIPAVLISVKLSYGGGRILSGDDHGLWRVSTAIQFSGTGESARIKMYIPEDTERQLIYNEHFDNDGMELSVQDDRSGNRRGVWRATVLEGSKRILYTFSVRASSRKYSFPEDLKVPDDAAESYPQEVHTWLDESEYIQCGTPEIRKQLRKLSRKRTKISVVVRNIYDFVSEDIEYVTETGSKDALKTLEEGRADCGGKSRLFVALCRAYGIPSRLVGGLILTRGIKHVTHVWAENYIDGKWIPFDTVNGHYAFLPDNYLELYRGDYFLIRHKGLSKVGWLYVIESTQMPPVDNPFSLYVLPIYLQNAINLMILIPLGAMIVAFMRNIIGINTFGTFAPMLLAIAFKELSLGSGLLIILTIIFLGWLLRKMLDHLRILFIPKISIILSAIVMLMIAFITIGFHRGQQQMYSAVILPLVIIAWIVERFTVAQMEDGTRAALNTALGTVIVAVAVYYVMRIRMMQLYLFAFPELILVIIAALLLIGRYTGMRASELWRFRELFRRTGRIKHGDA